MLFDYRTRLEASLTDRRAYGMVIKLLAARYGVVSPWWHLTPHLTIRLYTCRLLEFGDMNTNTPTTTGLNMLYYTTNTNHSIFFKKMFIIAAC